MSFWSDIFSIGRSRVVGLLTIAVILAALVGIFKWYAPIHDNPGTKEIHSDKIPFNYMGHPGTIVMHCRCPSYLIASVTRPINIQIDLTFDNRIFDPAPEETLWLYPEAGTAVPAGEGSTFLTSAAELFKTGSATTSVSMRLKPPDLTLSQINFDLKRVDKNNSPTSSVLNFNWPITVRSPLVESMTPLALSLLAFLGAIFCLLVIYRKYQRVQEEAKASLKAARDTAAQNPTKAGPAWELGREQLQAYFARNLAQVKQVFYVSVGVMIVGFAFVIYGVYLQLDAHDNAKIISPAQIASLSGLITQFIGATFMVIYRSTMTQANEFVVVLDRINTVGIAMKVLDQIPDDDAGKNRVRQDLITLLLAHRSKPSGPSKAKSRARDRESRRK